MKMLDISVEINRTIPVWEGDGSPEIIEEKTEYDQGTIQTTSITMNVHTGTHIDAPRHFFQEGSIAAAISLNTLVGPCQVLEISKEINLITQDDLQLASGFSPGTSRVLIKTKNSQLWAVRNDGFQKKNTLR